MGWEYSERWWQGSKRRAHAISRSSHTACLTPRPRIQSSLGTSKGSVYTGRVATEWPLIHIRVRVLPHDLPRHTILSQLPQPPAMNPKYQQKKRPDNTLSLLNAAIEAMNLAKEVSGATPAKAVFGTVSALLTMIRVHFLLRKRPIPVSHVTRTRWPTNPIMSSLG